MNNLSHRIYKRLPLSPMPQAGNIMPLPVDVKVILPVWLRGLAPRQYVSTLLLTVFFLAVRFVVHPVSPVEARAFPGLCDLLALNFVLFLFAGMQVPRHICRNGTLCPAVVLSVNPPLVAVCADLSKTAGETRPAIKILSQPLRAVSGPPLQAGDRLPAVSLLHSRSLAAMFVWEAIGLNPDSSDEAYWRDFSPVAVACVTDDPVAIQDAWRLLSSGDGWAELQVGLAQVPPPYRPGLYRLRPGDR